MSNVVDATTGAIESYRALVQLTPVAFDGHIERAGAEIVVRGPGGDARGPLSAAFLLAAHASARLAGPREPTLRFHDVVLCTRLSAPVYQPIAGTLAELATLAAELLAFKLASEAQSWRVSQKKREAAVLALRPLARELLDRHVERAEQERRLALDATPLPPPAGAESGPWKKEVREAIAARRVRAHPRWRPCDGPSRAGSCRCGSPPGSPRCARRSRRGRRCRR